MWSFKAGCVYECVCVCVFVKGGGYFLFLKRRYLERGCVSLLLFFLRGLPLFLRAGREEGGDSVLAATRRESPSVVAAGGCRAVGLF